MDIALRALLVEGVELEQGVVVRALAQPWTSSAACWNSL